MSISSDFLLTFDKVYKSLLLYRILLYFILLLDWPAPL